MIDLNELRRLAQGQEWIGRWYDAGCETLMAERNGEHEEVAHPYPIGLVPYLVAVQPTAITELLDRLEAAESDGLEQARLNGMSGEREAALMSKLEAAEKAASEAYQRGYATGQEEIEKERDTLRAKIEAMERQEPIAWQARSRPNWGDGAWPAWETCSEAYAKDIIKTPILHDWIYEVRALYALPGAQRAPGAPWVSLAERMPDPDKHDRVLIYTEGCDFGGEQVFDVKAESLNECRYIDPDEQPETCKAASHWMPHPRNATFDYAAHCAQPAPSVLDEEAAYSEWFHGEQGVAYDGMWPFAKAAWMARAALSAAQKPEGE